MTSRTESRASASGFTLMEILIVITLIVVLATILVVNIRGQRTRAHENKTRAMIETLRIGLQEYKRIMGYYPPDGIDSKVTNGDGTPIRSSACLYNFLCLPQKVVRRMAAGGEEEVEIPAILEPKQLDLSDELEPGAREILDSFGNPLHYDNLQEGVSGFSPQGAEVHLDPPDPTLHGSDPRELDVTETDFPRRGPQEPGRYDIWSHGASGARDVKNNPKHTIGSWQN